MPESSRETVTVIAAFSGSKTQHNWESPVEQIGVLPLSRGEFTPRIKTQLPTLLRHALGVRPELEGRHEAELPQVRLTANPLQHQLP